MLNLLPLAPATLPLHLAAFQEQQLPDLGEGSSGASTSAAPSTCAHGRPSPISFGTGRP